MGLTLFEADGAEEAGALLSDVASLCATGDSFAGVAELCDSAEGVLVVLVAFGMFAVFSALFLV